MAFSAEAFWKYESFYGIIFVLPGGAIAAESRNYAIRTSAMKL